MNLAMDADEEGAHGTAEAHRKNAQLCFECERTLRQMQNAKLRDAGERGVEQH